MIKASLLDRLCVPIQGRSGAPGFLGRAEISLEEYKQAIRRDVADLLNATLSARYRPRPAGMRDTQLDHSNESYDILPADSILQSSLLTYGLPGGGSYHLDGKEQLNDLLIGIKTALEAHESRLTNIAVSLKGDAAMDEAGKGLAPQSLRVLIEARLAPMRMPFYCVARLEPGSEPIDVQEWSDEPES